MEMQPLEPSESRRLHERFVEELDRRFLELSRQNDRLLQLQHHGEQRDLLS